MPPVFTNPNGNFPLHRIMVRQVVIGGPIRLLMALLLLFLVVAVVLLIVAVASRRRHYRGCAGHGGHRHGDRPATAPNAGEESDALRILDKRFARGDIDAEDYQARRALLTRSTSEDSRD